MTLARRRGTRRRTPRSRPHRLGTWVSVAVGVLVVALVGVLLSAQPHVGGDRLNFTDFIEAAKDGHIVDARILDVDSYVVGRYDPGSGTARYSTPYLKEGRERLIDILIAAGVPVTLDQQNGKRTASLASTLLPAVILVVLFLYLVLSFRRGTGLFGPSGEPRRVERDDATRVTFADVAGQRAAVAEIREVADFLADPERFADLGATVPKGILLFGPPGCGKTLLARALAGEAGASFLSISGSDFVELYVGVGAARVRELFREAREAAPAIVFIDELDAVGRSRAAAGGLNPALEQEQALNQILVQMDGFSPSQGIVVVAATNRPDVLDPALLRPGRFDRSIGLERPDPASRLEILALHAASKRVAEGVDLALIAERAIGLTGADLASVLNEAALLAARVRKPAITQSELDEALQRILEAPERQRRLSLRERSIARRFVSGDRVTFSDVAGADEAVAELAEVRDYLIEPGRFRAMGARIPRGVLLSGPPGCGKTLLARSVAGEANAAFFSVASSEFAERFTGVGAARIRELFAEARAVAPAIVFIDEIDTVGAARRGEGGSHEHEQTLNQLLAEMDGFDASSGLLVMGATNRPDLLDPALLRPGRFDRHVTVELPDRTGRLAILALYSRDKSLSGDVNLDTLAALTRGFSGAELANVLNEAALLSVRRALPDISMPELDEAIDRTLVGVSSRAAAMSEEERRMVAYHEAGHALVARALPGSARPHKLSIVGRGAVLGHCTVTDTHDRLVQSRSALLDEMAVALGGREAEVLVLGQPTSASGSDLRRVGVTARRMIRELGMSDELGPLDYPSAGSGEEAIVDHEARRMAEEARDRARSVLTACRPELDRLVDALLVRETMSAADIDEIVKAVVH